MDKGLKTESDEPVLYATLLADAERCPRCGRTVFYRAVLDGRTILVHGDRSACYALRDEP